MDTQKVETLLLTAFLATKEQREKSPELSASYETEDEKWEVAVRYVADLPELLKNYSTIEAEFLIGNYAILRGRKEELLALAGRDEILFMEASKRLFFSERKERAKEIVPKSKEIYALGREALKLEEISIKQIQEISGLESICLTRDFVTEKDIYGEGVYVAYLDTGIDYRHPEFIDEKGKSRIDFIWDQTKEDGYYFETEIQRALDASIEEGYAIVPHRDLSGHGTHVAAIGSGNHGVAPKSRILAVKLGSPKGGGVKTTELMKGVNACVNIGIESGRPVAINISYGTNYGSHNGYGILEQYLEDVAVYGRNVLVVGTGNEGTSNNHFQVAVEEIIERREIPEGTPESRLSVEHNQAVIGDAFVAELSVGEFQQSFSLQIWKEYGTKLRIYLEPAGESVLVELLPQLNAVTYTFSGMEALVYYGEPSPISQYQEIYLDFIQEKDFLPEGIWRVYFEYVGEHEQGAKGATVDLWLPVGETLAQQTGFLRSSPENTLTIPSTSRGVISVGAFDQRFDQYAPFSGRGYTWATNQIKPDLVAPGVEIVSASPGGGYTTRSGTSMATPFVTGASALLLEWGIVRKQDPYLYAEKIKAYFIRGAQPLPGIEQYPNPFVGYGRLCIRESIM